MSKLLKASEAAAILRISKPTLYNLARTKGFPSVWLGETVLRIPEDRLETWINQKASGESYA